MREIGVELKIKEKAIRENMKNPEIIEQIIRAVCSGERVEIVPVKSGIKILHIHKNEIK